MASISASSRSSIHHFPIPARVAPCRRPINTCSAISGSSTICGTVPAVDHTFSPRLRANVLYNLPSHLSEQPRGNNLNAPVNGVRPDPNFANIIEAVSDTEIRRHEVYVNATFNLLAPSPAVNRDRLNWRRLAFHRRIFDDSRAKQ